MLSAAAGGGGRGVWTSATQEPMGDEGCTVLHFDSTHVPIETWCFRVVLSESRSEFPRC